MQVLCVHMFEVVLKQLKASPERVNKMSRSLFSH